MPISFNMPVTLFVVVRGHVLITEVPNREREDLENALLIKEAKLDLKFEGLCPMGQVAMKLK